MKRLLRIMRMHQIALFILAISMHQLAQGMCGTTVNWHNRSDGPGGSDPGITSDVINQNIDVQGVNALVDGIHVIAQSCDIVVTVTNGDAVITGSGNRLDHALTDSSRLYLFAATGRTITFSLQYNLVFRGTANDPVPLDLLVTVSGGGKVQFFIKGEKQVSFTSSGSGGGTQVFIGMSNPNQPTLLFSRFHPLGSFGPAELGGNVTVDVGPKSCISYMAETTISSGGADAANEQATLAFDPSNTGTGCFILQIDRNSCIVIDGHWINTFNGGLNNPEITLGDIFMDVPAGFRANFHFDNS